MREQVFRAYGGFCACCGEDDSGFLTLDHVHGGGHAHRRERNHGMWRDVIAAGFPDKYQVLCFNCNLGRERNGGVCPHEAANPRDLATDAPSAEAGPSPARIL